MQQDHDELRRERLGERQPPPSDWLRDRTTDGPTPPPPPLQSPQTHISVVERLTQSRRARTVPSGNRVVGRIGRRAREEQAARNRTRMPVPSRPLAQPAQPVLQLSEAPVDDEIEARQFGQAPAYNGPGAVPWPGYARSAVILSGGWGTIRRTVGAHVDLLRAGTAYVLGATVRRVVPTVQRQAIREQVIPDLTDMWRRRRRWILSGVLAFVLLSLVVSMGATLLPLWSGVSSHIPTTPGLPPISLGGLGGSSAAQASPGKGANSSGRYDGSGGMSAGGGNSGSPAGSGGPGGAATSTPTSLLNSGAPTATPTLPPPPRSTPTPAATAGPPPTPTLAPTTATVTLIAMSQLKHAPHISTGCPSGCSWMDVAIHATNTLSGTYQSDWFGQTALAGSVTVSDTGSSGGCTCTIDISGGGYDCGAHTVTLPPGATTTVWCSLAVSSPSHLAPGMITGTCYGCGGNRNTDVWWSNQDLWGNGGWDVTSGACQNALNNVDGKTTSWQWSAWNQQASGLTSVSGPSFWRGNWTCSPGVGSWGQQYFTASEDASVDGLGYDVATVQAWAQAQLNAQLDNGYAWDKQSGGCAVATVGSSGQSITISCTGPTAGQGMAGLEVWSWDNTAKGALAGSLAGRSLSDAQATCNAASGVASGSCAINSNGASQMPSTVGSITVNVSVPPAPF